MDFIKFRDFDLRTTDDNGNVVYIDKDTSASNPYHHNDGDVFLVGYRVEGDPEPNGTNQEEFKMLLSDITDYQIVAEDEPQYTWYILRQNINSLVSGQTTIAEELAGATVYDPNAGEEDKRCQYGLMGELKQTYHLTKGDLEVEQAIVITSYTFIPPDEIKGNDATLGKYSLSFNTSTSEIELYKHSQLISSAYISGTGGEGSGGGYTYKIEYDSVAERYNLVNEVTGQVCGYVPETTSATPVYYQPVLNEVNIVTSGVETNSGSFIPVPDTENTYDLNLNIVTVKGDTGDTGAAGANGADGVGIDRIQKVSHSGLTDTYRITYTDNSTQDYTVENGYGVDMKARKIDCVEIGDAYMDDNGDLIVITDIVETTDGQGQTVYEKEWTNAGHIKGVDGEAYFDVLDTGHLIGEYTNQMDVRFYTNYENRDTENKKLRIETSTTGKTKALMMKVFDCTGGVDHFVAAESVSLTDGESAYEVAVRNGYTGTEAQWLASLKGDTGPQGEPAAINVTNLNPGVQLQVSNGTTSHTIDLYPETGTGDMTDHSYIRIRLNGTVVGGIDVTNGTDGTDGVDGTTFELYRVELFGVSATGKSAPYQMSYSSARWSKYDKTNGYEQLPASAPTPTLTKNTIVDVCPDTEYESYVYKNMVNGAFGLMKESGNSARLNFYSAVEVPAPEQVSSVADFIFSVKIYSNVQ